MTRATRLRLPPLALLASMLAGALAAAESADARGAVFKAGLSVRETIEETVTPEGCAVQGTVTQTVKAATRHYRGTVCGTHTWVAELTLRRVRRIP